MNLRDLAPGRKETHRPNPGGEPSPWIGLAWPGLAWCTLGLALAGLGWCHPLIRQGRMEESSFCKLLKACNFPTIRTRFKTRCWCALKELPLASLAKWSGGFDLRVVGMSNSERMRSKKDIHAGGIALCLIEPLTVVLSFERHEVRCWLDHASSRSGMGDNIPFSHERNDLTFLFILILVIILVRVIQDT